MQITTQNWHIINPVILHIFFILNQSHQYILRKNSDVPLYLLTVVKHKDDRYAPMLSILHYAHLLITYCKINLQIHCIRWHNSLLLIKWKNRVSFLNKMWGRGESERGGGGGGVRPSFIRVIGYKSFMSLNKKIYIFQRPAPNSKSLKLVFICN